MSGLYSFILFPFGKFQFSHLEMSQNIGSTELLAEVADHYEMDLLFLIASSASSSYRGILLFISTSPLLSQAGRDAWIVGVEEL